MRHHFPNNHAQLKHRKSRSVIKLSPTCFSANVNCAESDRVKPNSWVTFVKNVLAGVLSFSLMLLSMAAAATDQDVIDHYNRSCISCHASGAAGAPRSFVEADWKPRLAKGPQQLLLSAKRGINAMPPKGMCFDCTDTDYAALIVYMSTPKK
ncbi:MAG: sulfite reductase [Verrucomicrobiaceae bacterium]|nr:sulfite reductase [Verrucomicrobiaceae bacterium]